MTVISTGMEPEPNWKLLVQEARSGCPLAFGEIAEYFQDYLQSVANQALGNQLKSKRVASDIIQESLLEAFVAISNFKGSTKTEISCWLKRILLNNVADESRRVKNMAQSYSDYDLSLEHLATDQADKKSKSPSWHLARQEDDKELQDAIAQLSNRQKYVIQARHY